tara:strand:- start:657 stop:1799 length:1143 start_codon:yes stop_codon:yes gene_type:complete
MIFYIILSILLFIIIGYITYKVKYGYWTKQPVFHYHNIFYWYNPPGVIEKGDVEISKYYNPQIDFIESDKITTEKKELFATLLKSHFMPYKGEKYAPTTEGVMNSFQAHTRPSYIALNYDNERLISALATLPINIYFGCKKQEIYYADFLCVHPKYRKQGVAQNIINTVTTNHRLKDKVQKKDTSILFKREGKSMLIVPLTIYKNYVFDIDTWDRNVTMDEHAFIQLIKLTKQTSSLFLELLNKSVYKFKCTILQDLGHLLYLCEKEELIITLLLVNNEPVGFYVFRDPYITYDNNKSIEMIASYNDNTTNEIFALGFLCSIKHLNTRTKRLLMTDSGHNNIILNIILEKYKIITVLMGSYYFYNYATYPLMSYDVLSLV